MWSSSLGTQGLGFEREKPQQNSRNTLYCNYERLFTDILIINRESKDFLISSIHQIFSVEDIFQKYFNGMNTTYFAHKIWLHHSKCNVQVWIHLIWNNSSSLFLWNVEPCCFLLASRLVYFPHHFLLFRSLFVPP